MSFLRGMLQECKTRWCQGASRRPVSWNGEAPIVSITFDDVPYSAFQNGLKILDAYGAKGTFYVCLGIDEGPDEIFLGRTEIRALHQQGHEIGCHTFSHYRLRYGTSAGMVADAHANRREIEKLTGGQWPRGFAFPFGELSFSAKRGLGEHYDCLRSCRPGVNRGVVDFNCLRAVSLESGREGRNAIERWLDEIQSRPAWMIAYTHGVTHNPGRFDVTPENLEHLLRECRARRIDVVPVFHAAQMILQNS